MSWTNPVEESGFQMADCSKQRDPQSRRPYVVEWLYEPEAPQNRLWRQSEEIVGHCRTKSG